VPAGTLVARLIAVFLVLAGVLTGTELALRVASSEPARTRELWTERRALPISDFGALAPDWVRVARTLRPAVVHIGSWGLDGGKPAYLGLGSGFVINPNGYIVTNHHVIAGADKLQVRLFDGRELVAAVVGHDDKMDVALLKIEARDLPVMPFGDSLRLQVGEPVLAIGNPYGLDQSATAGIVSALDRQIELKPNDRLIQTDATINPGNSGGPLINRRGQAIGINTVAFTTSEGNTGIGFAIPSRTAEPIVSRLAAEARGAPKR
jgi:S1-C subfamily serine protease